MVTYMDKMNVKATIYQLYLLYETIKGNKRKIGNNQTCKISY